MKIKKAPSFSPRDEFSAVPTRLRLRDIVVIVRNEPIYAETGPFAKPPERYAMSAESPVYPSGPSAI